MGMGERPPRDAARRRRRRRRRRRPPLPTPLQWWIPVVLAATLLGPAMGVHITALRVPAVVRNGSRAGAVLDCEYALGAREQRRLASETGLVVKWFLVGSGPAPVYQWIPGQRPQDFGALRGRVDLAFKVTGSDERGAHRALRIPTPTTDLSGEYKCSVSTFEDEDFMVKRMLVFAPEQSLEMNHYKPLEDAVNVTCSARGVYPEPKVVLFWSGGGISVGGEGRATAFPLEGVSTRVTLEGDAYDVTASKVLQDALLPSPTVFDCQLMIAEADYIVRKSIVYYPNGSDPPLSSGCRRTLWEGSPVVRMAIALATLCTPLALGNLLLHISGGRLWTPRCGPSLFNQPRGTEGPPQSPALQRREARLALGPPSLPSGESGGL